MDFIWAIVGKCNITYDSLYKLSLSDLNKIAEGRNKETQEQWEMTRDIVYWTVKGWSSKKSLKETDLMKFPWDLVKELSKEKIVNIQSNAQKLRELIENGKVKFKA